MASGFKSSVQQFQQYQAFARRCKIIRERLELSVPQLSKLSGVSTTMIYYFEDGQRTLSGELCDDIVGALLKAIDARQKEDEKAAERLRKKSHARQEMKQELIQASSFRPEARVQA